MVCGGGASQRVPEVRIWLPARTAKMDCSYCSLSFYSAKYKKFATEQEAKDFVTASRDALSSQPPPLGKRKRAELEDSKGTPIDTHFRATSPATMALPASLPSKLQKIAQQGFSFTESAPHYLVVYTDGSARGNGQVGSRAGAGVWWGSQGEASKQ